MSPVQGPVSCERGRADRDPGRAALVVCVLPLPHCPPRQRARLQSLHGEGLPGGGTLDCRPRWPSGSMLPSALPTETPAPGPGPLPNVGVHFLPSAWGSPWKQGTGDASLGKGLREPQVDSRAGASGGSRKPPELWRPQELEALQRQSGPGPVTTRTWPRRHAGPRGQHSHTARGFGGSEPQEGSVARLWALWGGERRPCAPNGTTA